MAASGYWKGSILATIFVAIAVGLATIGGYAVSNGATIGTQTTEAAEHRLTHREKHRTERLADNREHDLILSRLATIEALIRQKQIQPKGPRNGN